jgi:hypothetical protein
VPPIAPLKRTRATGLLACRPRDLWVLRFDSHFRQMAILLKEE